MSNDRLSDFHPIPRGIHLDRRFRRLCPPAKLLLLLAHLFADQSESDGVVSDFDLPVLAALGGLEGPGLQDLVQEALTVGLLEPGDLAGEFRLVDFRGLSPEAHQRNRAKWREKAAGRKRTQPDYQNSPGESPRDSPGESQDRERE